MFDIKPENEIIFNNDETITYKQDKLLKSPLLSKADNKNNKEKVKTKSFSKSKTNVNLKNNNNNNVVKLKLLLEDDNKINIYFDKNKSIDMIVSDLQNSITTHISELESKDNYKDTNNDNKSNKINCLKNLLSSFNNDNGKELFISSIKNAIANRNSNININKIDKVIEESNNNINNNNNSNSNSFIKAYSSLDESQVKKNNNSININNNNSIININSNLIIEQNGFNPHINKNSKILSEVRRSKVLKSHNFNSENNSSVKTIEQFDNNEYRKNGKNDNNNNNTTFSLLYTNYDAGTSRIERDLFNIKKRMYQNSRKQKNFSLNMNLLSIINNNESRYASISNYGDYNRNVNDDNNIYFDEITNENYGSKIIEEEVFTNNNSNNINIKTLGNEPIRNNKMGYLNTDEDEK